jgi:3-oxoacyl-[acyl-carrier protein] reductase
VEGVVAITSIDLGGQRALVTGASTGIGRAVAVALAEAGADVGVHYAHNRNEAERTAALVKERGRRVAIVSGDFATDDGVGAAVEQAAAELDGSLDILVNNAGSLVRRAAVEEMDAALWHEVLDLNLSSVFLATRAALPHMGRGGRIVNVSSVAAHSGGGPGAFAYAAAKGGVISLTRGLAKALAPQGIRVNAISPGTIETPFHEHFSTSEGLEEVRRSVPLARLGTAEDCAGAVLFLVSPRSEFITGETIEVNGGQWFA